MAWSTVSSAHPKALWTKGRHGQGYLDNHGHIVSWPTETVAPRLEPGRDCPDNVYATFNLTPGGHADVNLHGPQRISEFYRLLTQAHPDSAPHWTRGQESVEQRWAHEANEPPHYFVQKSKSPPERCGVCTMFTDGKCWGYGNKKVAENGVCESFTRDKRKKASPLIQPPSPEDLGAASPHNLRWTPGQEGKGFILDDGAVWTWPTGQGQQRARPRHQDMTGEVRRATGAKPVPLSQFHIHPKGNVWFFDNAPKGSPYSRQHDVNQRAQVLAADPRLTYAPITPDPEAQQAAGYGHGPGVLDALNAQAKLAMPVTDSWWEEHTTNPDEELMQHRQPGVEYPRWTSLYHGTTPARAQMILEQGLKPWDELGKSNWEDYSNGAEVNRSPSWLRPRPGHVYFTNDKDFAHRIAPEQGYGDKSVLEIDPHYLDPQHINPDEDMMHTPGPTGFPGQSKGDVAEEFGWGNDPESAQFTLDASKALAYRGSVPPHAVKGTHSYGYDGWKFSPNPAYQPAGTFARVAMPVTPEYWDEWKGRTGPSMPDGQPHWLYHATHPKNVQGILQQGIHPAGAVGNRSPYEGMGNTLTPRWYEPRPGHTYFAQDPYRARELAEEHMDQYPAIMRVHPDFMEPKNINPDEDQLEEGAGATDLKREAPGAGSLGEIAEQLGWGDHTPTTEEMLDLGHPLAYRGHVPPEHITPGYMVGNQWHQAVPHRVNGWAAPQVMINGTAMHPQDAEAMIYGADGNRQVAHTHSKWAKRANSTQMGTAKWAGNLPSHSYTGAHEQVRTSRLENKVDNSLEFPYSSSDGGSQNQDATSRRVRSQSQDGMLGLAGLNDQSRGPRHQRGILWSSVPSAQDAERSRSASHLLRGESGSDPEGLSDRSPLWEHSVREPRASRSGSATGEHSSLIDHQAHGRGHLDDQGIRGIGQAPDRDRQGVWSVGQQDRSVDSGSRQGQDLHRRLGHDDIGRSPSPLVGRDPNAIRSILTQPEMALDDPAHVQELDAWVKSMRSAPPTNTNVIPAGESTNLPSEDAQDGPGALASVRSGVEQHDERHGNQHAQEEQHLGSPQHDDQQRPEHHQDHAQDEQHDPDIALHASAQHPQPKASEHKALDENDHHSAPQKRAYEEPRVTPYERKEHGGQEEQNHARSVHEKIWPRPEHDPIIDDLGGSNQDDPAHLGQRQQWAIDGQPDASSPLTPNGDAAHAIHAQADGQRIDEDQVHGQQPKASALGDWVRDKRKNWWEQKLIQLYEAVQQAQTPAERMLAQRTLTDAQQRYQQFNLEGYEDLPGSTTIPEEWNEHQAGMTLPQEQRAWGDQPGGQVIHSYPNGYTIQKMRPDMDDDIRAGEFMHNCWQSGEAWTPWAHTLNDEHGLPRAAFHVRPWGDGNGGLGTKHLMGALGPRNEPITPEHYHMLGEFAQAQGYSMAQQAVPEALTHSSTVTHAHPYSPTVPPTDYRLPHRALSPGGQLPSLNSAYEGDTQCDECGQEHGVNEPCKPGQGRETEMPDPPADIIDELQADNAEPNSNSAQSLTTSSAPLLTHERVVNAHQLDTLNSALLSTATDGQPEDRRAWEPFEKRTDRQPLQRVVNSEVTAHGVPGWSEVTGPLLGVTAAGDSGGNSPWEDPSSYFGQPAGEINWGYDPEHPLHKGFVSDGNVSIWKTDRNGQPHHDSVEDDQGMMFGPEPKRFVVEHGTIYEDENYGAEPLNEDERLALVRQTGARFPRKGNSDKLSVAMPVAHFNDRGAPCSCSFYHEPMPMWQERTAGKLHDFLMNPKSRPDLQTPEAQDFLGNLADRYHNEKTDALTPWLTREWKKGRIGIDQPQDDPYMDQNFPRNLVYKDPSTATRLNPEGLRRPLPPETVNHWADFYRSSHPLKREMGDIMQHDVHSFGDRVNAWDEDMKNRATQQALEGGEVVHTTPDGWTVRNLTTPEQLKAEGDAMGHCVGGYHEDVANGNSIIHSLRDPAGVPHATMEFEPQFHENPEGNLFDPRQHRGDQCPSCGATDEFQGDRCYSCGWPQNPSVKGSHVVQIQGKGNEMPKPEYQERIKHYFQNAFNDETRPTADMGTIDHIGDLDPDQDDRGYDQYGSIKGDYGLGKPETDYHSLVKSLIRHNGHDNFYYEPNGQAVYDHALKHGEIPQLAEGIEHNQQDWQQNFDDWRDMNHEHVVPYPDEEDFSDRDEYNNAMQRYEEDEGNWAAEHPGMQASSHLYGLIAPHWDSRSGGYINDPSQTPPPQTGTFSRVAADDPYTYYHVAPASARQNILRRGLQGQEDHTQSPWDHMNDPRRAEQPKGNYLWKHPEQAYDYMVNLKQRQRERGESRHGPQTTDDWYDYNVYPRPYGEQSHMQTPYPEDFHDWDEDSQEKWHENVDDNTVPYAGPHQLEEQGVPRTHQGWDIWKVRHDPERQKIQYDPENSIFHQPEWGVNPANWRDHEPSTWEAINQVWSDPAEHGESMGKLYPPHQLTAPGSEVYPDHQPMRWMTPQGVAPDQLELHDHVPHWAVPSYNGEEHWPGEYANEFEVPDQFTRVPMERSTKVSWVSAA